MKIGIIGQGFVGFSVYSTLKRFYNVFTYDLKESLSNSTLDIIEKECNVIFICVPTPMNKDGSCDISKVQSTIEYFSNLENKILVIKSTIIPGTTDKLNKIYDNKIVFSPEFLTERNALNDFKNQTRIILGGPSSCTIVVKNIFSKAFPNAQVIKTSALEAELIKYFTNCFLATKISFSNEIFQICKKLNIDYDKIVEYAITDKRIGNSHLNVPGHDGDFGFGGHCFPKDLAAFIKLTEDLGTINNVLKSVKKTNDSVRSNRDWEKMRGRAVN